jgi:hypothetical protein
MFGGGYFAEFYFGEAFDDSVESSPVRMVLAGIAITPRMNASIELDPRLSATPDLAQST